jgi:hypothetical protein
METYELKPLHEPNRGIESYWTTGQHDCLNKIINDSERMTVTPTTNAQRTVEKEKLQDRIASPQNVHCFSLSKYEIFNFSGLIE